MQIHRFHITQAQKKDYDETIQHKKTYIKLLINYNYVMKCTRVHLILNINCPDARAEHTHTHTLISSN